MFNPENDYAPLVTVWQWDCMKKLWDGEKTLSYQDFIFEYSGRIV